MLNYQIRKNESMQVNFSECDVNIVDNFYGFLGVLGGECSCGTLW